MSIETPGRSESDDRSLRSSIRDRARGIIGDAVDTAQNVTGALSGKSVEQLISEYSEQYTQVLLGMHQDFEKQVELVKSQSDRIDALEDRKNTDDSTIEKHQEQIDALQSSLRSSVKIARNLALGALTIAAVALVVSIWTVL